MESEPIEAFDKLLTRLDNLITFAERKNAELIVFNTTVLTVIYANHLTGLTGYKLIMLANMISFLIALFSFKPLGNIDDFEFKWEFNIFKHLRYSSLDKGRLNLLYYVNIAKFKNFKRYEEFLLRRYKFEVNDKNSLLIEDYVHEIFENARIANRKYKLFKIAMYINLFMIFVLVFMLFANE